MTLHVVDLPSLADELDRILPRQDRGPGPQVYIPPPPVVQAQLRGGPPCGARGCTRRWPCASCRIAITGRMAER